MTVLSSPRCTDDVPRDPAERLARLFDRDSLSTRAGDGVVTGEGTVDGVPVVAFATDAGVMGGAMGRDGSLDIAAAISDASRTGRPVIGIWHSGGARLAEGVASLDGVGRVFAATVAASGRVPQVSVVLGPAAGGAAYGPALTDVVISGPGGRVFVTGPDVVRRVTGEDADMEMLGGPETHGRRSGVVHVVRTSDGAALDAAREAVLLLGRPGVVDPARTAPEPALEGLLPANPRRAYDVRPLVALLLDPGSGFELQAGYARSVVTSLGRLGGGSVGVVATNPMRRGGCLDAASAEKAARFVRLCDSFGLPVLTVVDVPGYLPGVTQELDAVVRRGAKLLHAYAEAVVPVVTLVTRKAYGGAYIALGSRSLGASRVLAWPTAEVDVMGPQAAVEVLHRRQLAAVPEAERADAVVALAAEHVRASGGLARALAEGAVDAVIEPVETRVELARAVADTPPARGRHANIPL